MKKNIFVFLFILSMILSCDLNKEKNFIPMSVGLSLSSLNSTFFKKIEESSKIKAEELGLNLTVINASNDTIKQNNDIENLINKKVQVLIINPVDSDTITPIIDKAMSKGIKVISIDRAINGLDVDCKITSDNIAGSTLAGEYLIELVGTNSDVAEIIGFPGVTATIDRCKGFHNAVDGVLNLVSSPVGNFTRDEGFEAMREILKNYPDVKGVFAHNDEMALGALDAIRRAKKDVYVIGFDGTEKAIRSIANGSLKATIAQNPSLMASVAMDTAFKFINGEYVDKEILVEISIIK